MKWETFRWIGAAVVLVAFALTVALIPMVRRWAETWKFVAKPRDDRWHRQVTPLMGGVAIAMVLWILFGAFWALGMVHDDLNRMVALMLTTTAMGLMGLRDDKKPIAPQTKLLVQIILASTVVFLGFEGSWFVSKTANRFWSILWIVAMTNAFNLLDNMDGLSAGVASIACFFLLAVEAVSGHPFQPVHLVLVSLLGALLGFLMYNFHPASIFMGDCGSLQVGFLLGVATTQNHMAQHGPLLSVLAVPLFIFCLPLFDMLLVAVMRPLFGRSIGHGGRDHTSHRLVAIGLSEPKAVLFLYGFSAVGGLLALFMTVFPTPALPGAFAFMLFCAFLAMHLAKVRTYGPGQKSLLEKSETLTVLWIQWTYKKRMFEILLDVFLIAFAYWLSYFLRYDRAAYEAIFPLFLKSLPLAMISCLMANMALGLYRGLWEHTGTKDLVLHAGVVTVGVGVTVLALVFLYDFQGYSRSTFAIFWALWLLALAGSRVAFCYLSEFLQGLSRKNGPRVAIYGADERGAMILRELLRDESRQVCPVGFIDNDMRKQNARILGYRVLGSWDAVAEIVRRYKISEVMVPAEELERLPSPMPNEAAALADLIVRRVEIRIT